MMISTKRIGSFLVVEDQPEQTHLAADSASVMVMKELELSWPDTAVTECSNGNDGQKAGTGYGNEDGEEKVRCLLCQMNRC